MRLIFSINIGDTKLFIYLSLFIGGRGLLCDSVFYTDEPGDVAFSYKSARGSSWHCSSGRPQVWAVLGAGFRHQRQSRLHLEHDALDLSALGQRSLRPAAQLRLPVHAGKIAAPVQTKDPKVKTALLRSGFYISRDFNYFAGSAFNCFFIPFLAGLTRTFIFFSASALLEASSALRAAL